jgi:methylmalonyl-CoA/ethylmalonyl-CoA epimerase
MRLHHIAYTTDDLTRKVAHFRSLFGFTPIAEPIIDPVQKVRIQFLDMGGGSLMELLEPHGEKSPVAGHVKKGGGLYHLCFEVDDIVATLERLRETGESFVVCEPVPAPAIDNRLVAFVVTSDRDLVEFVQAAE